jgi:hypothetical protein
MAAYQVIEEKGKPKYVVLPFGDREALDDYLDELWAEKAVKAFETRKDTHFHALEDVRLKILNKKPSAK